MAVIKFNNNSLLLTAIIRKYGITSYIRNAMVVFPYISTIEKLKFQFSLLVYTQFDFYQRQSGEHVES